MPSDPLRPEPELRAEAITAIAVDQARAALIHAALEFDIIEDDPEDGDWRLGVLQGEGSCPGTGVRAGAGLLRDRVKTAGSRSLILRLHLIIRQVLPGLPIMSRAEIHPITVEQHGQPDDPVEPRQIIQTPLSA